MRFTCDFELPEFDLQAYRDRLDAQMSDQIRQAARIWLQAARSVVPTWSGESQATFFPLARRLGLPATAAPSARARNFPRRMNASHDVGELHLERSRGTYEFEYATDLDHLIYNEFNNANVDPDPTLFSKLITPGPYRFQERASTAFNNFARSVRLPDPRPFLRITQLRVR